MVAFDIAAPASDLKRHILSLVDMRLMSSSVVTLSSPSRTRHARAQARLPIFGGDSGRLQTGPVRRGLLARRFPLRGAGNNFTEEFMQAFAAQANPPPLKSL